MARPTDWDVLGLGGDPTPGNPDRIDEVARSTADLGRVAREVDTELAAVLSKTGPEAFAGATADALREKISGRLRNFVQSMAESFEWSSAALTTYAHDVRDQQWRADNALQQARGLAKDDPALAGLATTAKQAGSSQSESARAASATLDKAAGNIKQPVSACDEFWDIFKWIAIVLILPALVFGGAVALLAIAVNLTLFIKTAIDFAQGKASMLEFFLSALGILAPTTRAIPLVQLITAGSKLIWGGIKAGAFAVFNLAKGVFTGIFTHPFVLLPGLHDLVVLNGSWVRGGALWIRAGITSFPSWAGTIFTKSGLAIVTTIKGIPGALSTIPPALGKFGVSTWKFLGNELGGYKWMRIILPLEADELGKGFGAILPALKLAVVDRGILGKFVFGKPFVNTVGSSLHAVPTPAPHLAGVKVDLSSLRITETHVGDLAVPHLATPQVHGPVASGLIVPPPQPLHFDATFGEALHFGHDSTLKLNGLLDTPLTALSNVHVGGFDGWANHIPTPTGVDAGLGVSALAHTPPPAVTNAAVNLVASPPPVHVGAVPAATSVDRHLLTPTPINAAVALVTQPPAPHVVAVATRDSAPHLTALHLTAPDISAAHPPAPGVNAATVSPHVTQTHVAGAEVVVGHLGAPGVESVGAMGAPHLVAAPAPATAALDLLAGAPNATAAHALAGGPGGLVGHTGGPIAEHTSMAISAQHVSLDLGSTPGQLNNALVHHVVAPPVTPMAKAATPPPTAASVVHSPDHTGAATPVPDIKGKGRAAEADLGAALNLVHPSPATHADPFADKAFAGSPVAAHASPAPVVDAFGVPKLTGAEIDVVQRVDSSRIGALFGAIDDPARPGRLDAWSRYVEARYHLARAQHTFDSTHTLSGGTFAGPSTVDHGQRLVDGARQDVVAVQLDLRALGVNPDAMEIRLAQLTHQSLNERPRLLGGSPEMPAIRVTDPGGNPVEGLIPIRDVTHQPTGQQIDVRFGSDGAFRGRVLDQFGRPDDSLAVHQLNNDVYQVTTAGSGDFVRLQGDGVRIETGTALRDLNGTPLPDRFFVTPRDGSPGHFETTGPARYTITRNGDLHQITDTQSHDSFMRFDATGALTHVGVPLRDAATTPLPERFVVTPHGGGPHVIEADPARFRVDQANGVHQVTDLGAHHDFLRFDANFTHTETGVRLRQPDGEPLNSHYLVTPTTAGGRVETEPGVTAPGFAVTPHNGGFRVTDTLGVRAGEYRDFAANGALTHQAVNVVHDGRPTGDQLVMDVRPGAKTWHATDAAGNARPGYFNHGKVDGAGAVNGRIHLVTDKNITVFERRPLPDGSMLDMVRRSGDDFSHRFAQRPWWTQTRADGTIVDHGLRHFDTSGFSWSDVSHDLRVKHEFRKGLDGRSVLAVKGPLGIWNWHRYDAAFADVAHGPRTYHQRGGWTDRLPDAAGRVMQRQWGKLYGPDHAFVYREHDLAGGLPQVTWKSQSPQGKDLGKLENLPGGFTLKTARWSEQRPPNWVRTYIMGIRGPVWDGREFLRTDTKFQMFTWTRTAPDGTHVDGFRFVGMNESALDIAADGTFARFSTKLDHGNTLKVGDSVSLPAGAQLQPGYIPWTEGSGKLSGHRFDMTAAPGADSRIFEDRFTTNPHNGDWYSPDGTPWRVARAGYPDGTVKEFLRPPTGIGADGGWLSRDGFFENANGPAVWVVKDPHGAIVGRQDVWPGGPAGTSHTVRAQAPDRAGPWRWTGYNARTDSRSWTWTAQYPPHPDWTTGTRQFGRGFNGPAHTFDDSFADFANVAGVQTLIRDRRMLGDGSYVDSWRVPDQGAPGGFRWEWRKIDKYGNIVDYPGRTSYRQWWNPSAADGAGGWATDWFHGATRFRDDVMQLDGHVVTVREIPPGAPVNRVREYLPGGAGRPQPGVWKEFDHGVVVRERKLITSGDFLEEDKWRGQWRRYDPNNIIIAHRTDGGYVFEGGSFDTLALTGREYDYRGPLTALRGWGRRIREPNRMPWGGQGTGGLAGEALYQPYWKLVMQKAALEWAQEFILELVANIAVNGIVDAINGTQFNALDVGKAALNGAVGATLKTAVGTAMHDNRLGSLQATGNLKAGLANIDGGKPWFRKPMNHDKYWSNEWAGNETAARWRSGTYDFVYNVPVTTLTSFVNGSINAAVFGFKNADGTTVYAHGGAAALDGLINAAAGLTSGIAKQAFMSALGSRLFHRQGFGEFALQVPWKIAEKTLSSVLLVQFRQSLRPYWYTNPAPSKP